ncbi:zinc dependent phospholipase C family protein [Exiguobacterium sp. TDN 0502]|uniref:zinc dependent phospholipase C family protein n=1 Tax=Exiguobacterium sp. TDN 0502 TaxID=3420731 RepID=UPI003D783DBC
MGSRLMHAYIGQRLITSLPELDPARFLLGAVAPDARYDEKEQAHYYTGELASGTRAIDYEAFWKDATSWDPSFRSGYYVHLIADDIWLRGFYMSWLRQAIIADASIGSKYHDDFKRYNTRIAPLVSWDEQALTEALDELRMQSRWKALPHFIKDLEEDRRTVLQQEYDILLPLQLDGYIETAIERSIYHLAEKGLKIST